MGSDDKALAAPLKGLATMDEAALVASLDTDARGTADADSVQEALGNRAAQLQDIKVAHDVAQFLMPDGTMVPSLTAIAVAFTYHNSFFGKPYDEHEQGELPPCFSVDAATVSDRAEDPQSSSCASCPKNRGASDPAARDNAFNLERHEACNNYLTLALYLPGHVVPYKLRLSNRSFKPFATYAQRIGTGQHRLKLHEAATELTLEKVQGRGKNYSEARFALKGPLAQDMRAAMAEQSEGWRAVLQFAASQAEESTDEGADAMAEARAAAKADDTEAPL